jgi:hypothetical protein
VSHLGAKKLEFDNDDFFNSFEPVSTNNKQQQAIG